MHELNVKIPPSNTLQNPPNLPEKQAKIPKFRKYFAVFGPF